MVDVTHRHKRCPSRSLSHTHVNMQVYTRSPHTTCGQHPSQISEDDKATSKRAETSFARSLLKRGQAKLPPCSSAGRHSHRERAHQLWALWEITRPHKQDVVVRGQAFPSKLRAASLLSIDKSPRSLTRQWKS